MHALRLTLTDTNIALIAELTPYLRAVHVERPLTRHDDPIAPPFNAHNSRGVRTTRADTVQPGGDSAYNLTGDTTRVAVWDEGVVRTTHIDFTGRASARDNAAIDNHGTHCAGSMVGAGLGESQARGMAFGADIWSYDWVNDTDEATANGYYLTSTNHSYGPFLGWDTVCSDGIPSWFGTRDVFEDPEFGKYTFDAQATDFAAWTTDVLPVWSAGNERNDVGVAAGQPHHLGTDCTQTFTEAHPSEQDIDFDTIGGRSAAKNILTVGAISPVLYANPPPGDITVADFSAFGPMDDNRVKPDLVAPGINVRSTGSASDTAYANLSGTSMAAPIVAGGLALLAEMHRDLNNGLDLSAAELKAITLLTTVEAGPSPGPDYQHGYGLLNIRAAADLIAANDALDDAVRYGRSVIGTGQTRTFTIEADDGGDITPGEAFSVILAWIDPPGSPNLAGVDDPEKALQNNLDLELIAPDGTTTFYPWSLNAANPDAPATRTAPNNTDPVERIDIAAADNTFTGKWTLKVRTPPELFDFKPQSYALAATRAIASAAPRAPALGYPRYITVEAPVGGTAPAATLRLRNLGDGTLTWVAAENAPWLALDTTSGTTSANVTLTFDMAQIASPGVYTATIAITATDEPRTRYVGVTLNASPCTPVCDGKSCGPDTVCGASCGTCPSGSACNAIGQCIACIGDDYEPDNNAPAAKSITIGDTQSRNLCDGFDWVAFTVAQPQGIVIQSRNIGSSARTRIALYAADQTTLLASADSTSDPNEATLQANLASAGTHYIRISSVTNTYGLNTQYALTVTDGCIPACNGKQCGDNGCDGICGDCDDNNPCTIDACNPDGTCTHDAASAEDDACTTGNFCLVNETCKAGECIGVPRDCQATAGPCAVATCNEDANRCDVEIESLDGTACDDGNFCTLGDTCIDGSCTPDATRDCDDGVTCTTDTCDPSSSACRNEIPLDRCVIDGVCYTPGAEKPDNPCLTCRLASPTDWTPRGKGFACGREPRCVDQDFIAADACDGAGTCVEGTPKDCAPYNSCDPALGCPASCDSDADCLAGFTCRNERCLEPLADDDDDDDTDDDANDSASTDDDDDFDDTSGDDGGDTSDDTETGTGDTSPPDTATDETGNNADGCSATGTTSHGLSPATLFLFIAAFASRKLTRRLRQHQKPH